jgi:hypothetical protein
MARSEGDPQLPDRVIFCLELGSALDTCARTCGYDFIQGNVTDDDGMALVFGRCEIAGQSACLH